MKGFIKVEITQSMRVKMNRFIVDADNYKENYVISKNTVGRFLFKRTEYIFRKDAPPDGLVLVEGCFDVHNLWPMTTKMYESVKDILDLSEKTAEVYLSEKLVSAYNKFK